MRTPFLWILTLILAAVSYSCTPEDKPGSSSAISAIKIQNPILIPPFLHNSMVKMKKQGIE